MAYRYKTVKVAGKTKLLHRHLAEQALGRLLLRSEHVHHVNGDCHDNRPENLRVMDHAEHQREHKQKHPIEKLCLHCGLQFVPHPTKRARKESCSPACGRQIGWSKRRANYSERQALRAAA